jgi:hypothetical protein
VSDPPPQPPPPPGWGPQPQPPPPQWGPPQQAPQWGPPQPQWGQPPPGQPWGYGPPPQQNNGLAIASFICSLASVFTCGVSAIVAIVLGHIALSQIKRGEGATGGRGLAMAGVIIGYVVVGLGVLLIVVAVATSSHNSSNSY